MCTIGSTVSAVLKLNLELWFMRSNSTLYHFWDYFILHIISSKNCIKWECTVILTKNCLMLENYHVTQEFGPFSNYGVNGEPRKLRKKVFSISQKYSVKL